VKSIRDTLFIGRNLFDFQIINYFSTNKWMWLDGRAQK
jgi:hypothetical protein